MGSLISRPFYQERFDFSDVAFFAQINEMGERFGREAQQRRLAALCAQAAVSIENAQLFEDVSNSRNYNESILRSMSNGVLTLDAGNTISKVNQSALRILQRAEQDTVSRKVGEVFDGPNSWVTHSLEKVLRTGRIDSTVDSDLVLGGRRAVSVNMTAVPLQDVHDDPLGSMLIMEDITREKRLRNALAAFVADYDFVPGFVRCREV